MEGGCNLWLTQPKHSESHPWRPLSMQYLFWPARLCFWPCWRPPRWSVLATHRRATRSLSANPRESRPPPATGAILPPGLRGGTGLSQLQAWGCARVLAPGLSVPRTANWNLSRKLLFTLLHCLLPPFMVLRILPGCPKSLCLDTDEWINNTLNQVKSMHHLAQGHVHFKRMKEKKRNQRQMWNY